MVKRPWGVYTGFAGHDRLSRIQFYLSTIHHRPHYLFETAQDGILILEAETGQIRDVNPFLVDMLGYLHEALSGKKLWEIGDLPHWR